MHPPAQHFRQIRLRVRCGIIILLCVWTGDASAQWYSTNGPFDRTVGDLLLVPPDSSGGGCILAIAGNRGMGTTSSLGLYRSTNRGGNWKRIEFALSGVQSLIRLPRPPGRSIILVGGAEIGVVFGSTDNGETWNLSNAASLLPGPLGSFALLPAGEGYPGTLFTSVYSPAQFGSTLGIFRSTDDGSTWSPCGGLPSARTLSMYAFGTVPAGVKNRRALYVCLSSGPLRSFDNGETWESVPVAAWDPFMTMFAVPQDSSPHAGAILAGTDREGILRSDDDGGHWTPLGYETGLRAYSVNSLVGSPISPLGKGTMIYAGTDEGVYRTPYGGKEWTYLNFSVGGSRVQAVSPPDSAGNHELYVSTYSSLLRSTNDGSAWVRFDSGFLPPPVHALHSSRITGTTSGNLFAGTMGSGVAMRSSSTFSFWSDANGGIEDLDVLTLAEGSPGAGDSPVLFAGTNGRGLFRSTDGGRSWQESSQGLSGKIVSALHPRYGAAGDSLPLYAGTLDEGLFRSADGGSTWRRSGAGSLPTGIRTLAEEVRGAVRILYAGTNAGVFRSSDGGNVWSVCGSGILPPDIGALHIIHPHPFDATTLFAGSAEGISRSTDGGESWLDVNMGLAQRDVRCFADSGSVIFAGTAGGRVFLSTNNGTSWSVGGTGLTGGAVHALLRHGSYLAAGTDQGVWMCPLSWLIDISSARFLPPAAYPNPFRGRTTVGFQLREAGHVLLEAYDLLGRKVATILDEERGEGRHDVPFTPPPLPAGMYLLRMESAGLISYGKVTLIGS